ncbi:MAG: hypothetical protein RR444_10615 [Oscillospiraceae bacterium]
MKKTFIFVLSLMTFFALSIQTFAAESNIGIEYLSNTVVETANELFNTEISRQITESDVDFSKAYKIYVDTNVFQLETDSKSIMLQELEKGNFIYELPIYIDGSTLIVNIAKGQPLNQNAEFTDTEKQKIIDNVDKWQVTAIKYYDGEIIDYRNDINTAMGVETNNAILIGGLPNFKYAVALIADNNDNITTLIPLSGVPGVEAIANFAINTNAFNYQETKEFVNSLPQPNPNEASGYGFPVKYASTSINYLMVCLIALICVASVSCLIVFLKKQRKG